MGTPSEKLLQETNAQDSSNPPSTAVDIQASSDENNPHETKINIGSLSVSPKTQSGLGKQLSKFPVAISKLFRTQYFKLYRPLEKWHEKALLFCAVVLSLAAGVPLPIIGVLFGKIINNFPPDEKTLETRLIQLVCVASAYFIVTWGWSTCWGMVGEKISKGLRERVLRKAMGMDMAYFEVEAVDIAHRLTADTQTIQLGVSEKCGLFLQSISYFIAAFTTGFILNARLTGILFIAVIPPMAFVIIYGTSVVSKYAQRAASDSAKANSVAEGAIGAVQVVQAFGALDRLAEEHLRLMGLAIKNGIRKSICGALMLGSVYFVAYSANAVAFYEGSRLITSDGFNALEGAGTVYTVVFLILDAAFVVGHFGPFLQTFALAAAAGENILAIIDHPEPVINSYSKEGIKLPLEKHEGVDIKLDKVSFAYPARAETTVLDNVTLNIKAGTLTAIVGSSGSGKSTIASLLLRFYDPKSGSVIINGQDLRSLNLRDYRSHVALVDQEPVLFAGTVLENISHGLLHETDLPTEEITRRCHQAARDANAYDFISRLPDGFETKIGGTGATQLSGGQKQRIAIARAIVGNPAVLVLDEPTSALDATAEAVVLEALDCATSAAGRTTIMIAHRLATVKSADTIIVMANGKTVEQGNHRELIDKGGMYFELVKAQKLLSSSSSSSSLDTKVEDTEKSGSASKLEPLDETVTEESPIEESKATYSSGTLVRRCLEVSKGDRWLICLGLFACIVTGAMVQGEAVVFGSLITTLNDRSDEERLRSRARFFCLMFFMLSMVALLSFTISGSMFGIVSERLIRRMRDKSLRTILRQDISWFESPDHSPARLISMISMDTGHLSGLSGVILGTIFTVMVSMTGGIILAHIVAWRIAVVILAVVPLVLLGGFLRLRILGRFEARHTTAYLGAAGLAKEACDGMRTVAALGKEFNVIEQYHDAIDKPYRDALKFISTGNIWLAMSLSMGHYVYSLAYWWGAKQVRAGNCTPLEFFIAMPALLFSAQGAGQMFSVAPEVTRAKTGAKSVFKLHDQKPLIDSGIDQPAIQVRQHPDSDMRGKVEFRNVDFTYKSRPNNPVLNSLSFTVQPGQFVALVGPSGAGKSSAVALLERFYDVNSGAVLVDDSDIRSMDVRDHRRRISLVSQEPCLFPGSIAFNIGLGATGDATHEDIVRVSKMCGIHDFIMGLPDGYETNCGTNGSQLSGGQKQRVALARALIRDPDILLLDEATSALDSHSENLVKESIDAARKGRTCIAVAHRLASVQHADRIYVLAEGKVVETGRHSELIAMGGVYASMSRQQTLA